MANEAPISGTVGVFRAFGVPIRLHFTFLLLLAFLLFISLRGQQSGAFTALYILALFGSVILHELGHALVAKRYGIRTIEIVMFPIGGLARLDRQPRAREELWIAIAGPAVNLVIASMIYGWLAATGNLAPMERMADPEHPNLLQRIGMGNLILAVFNLLPAYPMDGGRVLRALIAFRKTEDDATRIAAGAGQMLAIMMGLYGLLSANFMLIFIAMFVYLGATQEAAVAKGRVLTSGHRVRDAMITDYRTLQHGATIRDAGNVLLSTSQQDFPVMAGEQVLGLLTRSGLMRAMMAEGPESYVAGAMERNFTRLNPDADLSESLTAIGNSAALVMDGDQLVGLLTAENLTEFLLLRQVGFMRTVGDPV